MAENEVRERRVTALEQEVEGEKLVTGHILEQTRRNGDDIAAIRTQLGRIEVRLDRTEAEVRGVRSEMAGLKSSLQSLRTELPGIVAETMREVLRERER
jgi:chromosome segregation ATPase